MRMGVVLPVASSRLFKKTHLHRCASPPRSNVMLEYAFAWPVLSEVARLASGIFLISLESGFQPLFIHCPLRAGKDF